MSTLPAGTTRYVAEPPVRLLDTRTQDGVPPERVGLEVAVDRVTAAYAVSVSVMETQRGGSVSLDAGRGPVTAVDLPAERLTTTNLVLVPAVAGHPLDVVNTTGGEVVVDLVGRFEPSTGSTAGRFVSAAPRRLIHHETDTDGRQAVVTLPADVGLDEPVAAVLALVSADVGADGGAVRLGPAIDDFDQMLMWGPRNPEVTGGADRRGVVLVQPGADGTFAFRYDGGSVLDIDVVGYFTSADADWDTAGLFVPSDDPATFGGSFGTGPARFGELPSWAGAAFVTLTASGTAPTSDPLDLAVARGRTVGTVLPVATAAPEGPGTRSLDVFSSGPVEARVQVLGAFVEQ